MAYDDAIFANEGPGSMRVTGVRIHAYGGSDQLRLEAFEIAPPGPGEALVRHRAIGVNFADIHNRTGRYPLPSLPHVLGGEAAGIVEAIGPDVREFKPGDRVAYAAGGPDFAPGAYAEARVTRVDRLVGLPEEIDDVTAASIMTKGLTAQYLLKAAYHVAAGDTILVHAAAGGVGLLMTQWARHLGCRVIGVVSSDAKAETARASCHHVIVSVREDIASRVRALTAGRGVPVVYDFSRPRHVSRLASQPRAARTSGVVRFVLRRGSAVRSVSAQPTGIPACHQRRVRVVRQKPRRTAGARLRSVFCGADGRRGDARLQVLSSR